MKKYEGKSTSGSIAVGDIWEWSNKHIEECQCSCHTVEIEKKRLEEAVKQAELSLQKVVKRASLHLEQDKAAIFRVHQSLLSDEGFLVRIKEQIEENQWTAEYSIEKAYEYYSALFASADDAILQSRVVDLKDVVNRLLQCLKGEEENYLKEAEGILLIEEITPEEVLMLSKEKVKGIVTRTGTLRSHSALVAAGRDIPMLLGVNAPHGLHGKSGIIDGQRGVFLVDVDENTQNEYWERMVNYEKEIFTDIEEEGKEEKHLSPKVKVMANISTVEEAMRAFVKGADGIGLFRSEFIYLGRKKPPTFEEQASIYSEVVRTMRGKEVSIRLFDLGADKRVDYLNLSKGDNTALGYRGIRLALEYRELLRVQLKAILVAAGLGPVSIMVPMVTNLWEVKETKKELNLAKEELDQIGMSYGEVDFGIMIETPAAALLAEELAKEVDFFSIGTNDLTQYVLGVDRGDDEVEQYYDPTHPAVLELIERVIEKAHKAGIKVSVCGEMAGNEKMTNCLVEMSVDSLSVVPSQVANIKKRVM